MNLEWLLERQLAWISQADAKLAVLGPLPLAMLAISLSGASVDFNNLGWTDLPIIISTVLLSVSLFCCKAALTPRLKGPEESSVFFARIAQADAEEFATKIQSLDEVSFRVDLIHQIHINAKIADQKHRNVSYSVWWLTFATPIWLLTIALEF